ncbi:MAG: hypothetical protein QCI82_11125 [Candidatus Thermoplasmatota archaeon]|nr:hypothetical protein [Candidatus Thermoplasmatota archaeon]
MLFPSTCGLLEVHSALLSHFGDPHWWPGETSFEIAIGAILTQNTSWSNVETSIAELKRRRLLDPHAMASASLEDLSMTVRSSGYHRVKASYLRSFSEYLIVRYNGSMEDMRHVETSDLRRELLGVRGIGEETADSILCYALSRPVLVIDAYTRRLIDRLSERGLRTGATGRMPTYSELQRDLMGMLKGDNMTYNSFHALIVLQCREHCKTRPLCINCPLLTCCATGKKRI